MWRPRSAPARPTGSGSARTPSSWRSRTPALGSLKGPRRSSSIPSTRRNRRGRDPAWDSPSASPSSRCTGARLESRTRRAAEAREPRSSCGASDPRGKETVMHRARVLLIDDEPSFTRMLKLNLERRGFEVMVENNGANAYAAARQFLPDFILLDVIMPDVDGGEVASRIRGDAGLH